MLFFAIIDSFGVIFQHTIMCYVLVQVFGSSFMCVQKIFEFVGIHVEYLYFEKI